MSKKPRVLGHFSIDNAPKSSYNRLVPTERNGPASKVCFSYIRFSSRVQAKGDSERRQLEIAPRVAQAKGWILREDLNERDLGVSAHKGSNLETIEGIIEAAQERKIPNASVMIIEALDRLTRIALDDAYQLFRRLLKAGIEIYTDRTGRHLTAADLNNPMSLMMTVVELDAAFQYSDRLSDRVGKAWRQKKARAADGVKLTAMAPAWVDVDRKTNTIKTNEKAEIVTRIFDSYANGKGIRTIMRELNADKIPTFGKGNQNRGNGWASTHLRRLLSFRGVIGEYQPCKSVGRIRQPDGAPIADYYPAVVDKATFYKVQQILSRNGHVGGCKRSATNLFTGLVKCAKCGGSMVIKHSPAQKGRYKYISLVCNNALRGNGCGYHTIQYHCVERAVLTTLWVRVLPSMSGADTRKDQLCTMQGQLRDTELQIKKWMKLIEESETPPANAMRRLSSLETRQTALNHQLESLSATINDNPMSGWQQVPRTIENRLRLQSILRNEIDSLTIDALNRVAILKMKEPPEACFEFAWEPSSANGTKQNPASRRFLLWGDYQEYLDDVLVWKSNQNINLRSPKFKFVDAGREFVFGVEIEPNKIGLPVTVAE